LVACGWVEADRRTPIIQTPAEPLPVRQGTAMTWASEVAPALSCKACGRIVIMLASLARPGEWFTRMSASEIGTGMGLHERTVREHLAALTGERPHARHHQAHPLLHGERVAGTAGRGGLRWQFLGESRWAGSLAETYSRAEYRALERQALDLLSQAPLITWRMTADARTEAAKLLVARLHLGYPPAVLLERMTHPSDHADTARTGGGGLIWWRLREYAPLTGYVPSARETYDRTPVRQDCVCGRPFWEPRHITQCPTCRRREAAGISLATEQDAEAREYQRIRGLIPPAPLPILTPDADADALTRL
ncbi:hypothetical protein, partial [Streptomyces sp. NPDC054901]